MKRPNEQLNRLERLSQSMSWTEIGDLSDPVFRNYLITHNYWRLSDQMGQLLGRENLVWPGFGAWASAQAGSYMRHEGMPFLRWMPQMGARITELLGRGNRLIFLDIAPPFSRFIDLVSSGDVSVQAEHRRLAEAGRDEVPAYLQDELGLDPRLVSESPEGQRAMIWALTEYFLAMHEDCPEARAERIFVGNCLVGLQEQTRVDCMLDALLDIEEPNRLVVALASPVVWMWGAFHGLQDAVRRRLGKRGSGGGAGRCWRIWRACLVEGRLTQVLGTQLVMEFELGGDELPIGEDVPWSSPQSMFPPHLARIDVSSAGFRARLDELLEWDRTPDTTDGSAALDWSELADRMNYIIDLFRTRQQDARLHIHPLQIERSW